jgi:excisionase family DNA binding protein
MSNSTPDNHRVQSYLSTAEAAKSMGVSEKTVRDLCRRGLLAGAKQTYKGGLWRIPEDAVNEWIMRHSSPELQTQPESEAPIPTPIEQPTTQPRAELLGTPFWRKVLAIGAIIGILAGAAGFLADSLGVWDHVKHYFATATPLPITPASEDETLILIATFHRTEGIADTDAHNEIRRAIQAAAADLGLSNLRVEVEPTSIAADARNEAQGIGQRYGASMIIWGEDTGVRTTVNYLNLREPDFDAAEVKISETVRTQLASPSSYASFITKDLPGQLTFLSLFAIGQSYIAKEDYKSARKTIERAISSLALGTTIEGLVEAYFRLGWLYSVPSNDYDQALANYSQAIRLDPYYVMAYNNRGLVYEQKDDPEQALADYNQAIRLNPSFGGAYVNRGNVYINYDDLDGALADYNQAIRLDPNLAEAYYNRGFVYYIRDDPEQALADYNQAIRLDPNLAEAYYYRGPAYAPYLNAVPSLDGTALFIYIQTATEFRGTVFAHVGIGTGHRPVPCAMVYSDIDKGYVTTASGFTPGIDAYGLISITTTLGLDTGVVEFNRDYVPASTPHTLVSQDGKLELEIVSADTISYNTYILVVPSYGPPEPLPSGHRLVGSAYSVRAAGALIETARPMLMRLYYDETTLAGADPHTLAVFRWDAFSQRWKNVGGDHFADGHYLSVATSQFTTYALMATTTWHDAFPNDFTLSGMDEKDNVKWDALGSTLVLSGTATSGHAVTKPITPAAGISNWGSVIFTGTVALPTQTLTVDVLSLDGSPVMTNVASGTSLANLDPAQYPALKLRVNLTSTVPGQTPSLDDWQLSCQSSHD